MDNLDKHSLAFGNLMGNILSLEFLLRVFLLKTTDNSDDSFPEWDRFNELKEGDLITLNAFTKDRYFSEVVSRYNSDSRIKKRGLHINDSLVDLRNALAHGLISGLNPSPPLRLLHIDFNKKQGVKFIKFSALMTTDWFNKQIVQVRLAMENVEKAIELLEGDKL
jgi:hypothetical protein